MAAPSTATDDELFRRLRAGDEEAFAALYRRHQGGIYRFALRMSGRPTLAEDVTQEVFMTLLRGGDGYDPGRGTLASYAYGVARNLVRRRLERERRYEPMDDAGDDGFAALDDDPHATLRRGETVRAVRRAVLALPAHYREAVVLCDLQGLTYEEAAAALGCAVGTVRSRLHRARGLLVGSLGGGGEAPAAVPGATTP